MTNFRKITHQDIEVLLVLMTDFYAIDGYPIDPEITRKNFVHFIENPNLGQSFIIEHDGKVAGYIILNFLFSFEFGGTIAFLDELYVDSNFQGKGLGKLGVAFSQEFAKEKDLNILFLEVELHNERAIELYKKYNFKPHHRNLMIWKNR